MTALGPELALASGARLPRLGFGTFRLEPGAPTRRAVETALAAGYRHIDTASIYGNEADVGAAVRASGIPRADLWITTKLWRDDDGPTAAREAFLRSCAALDLGPPDLYLLHWPTPRRAANWTVLQELRDAGEVREVGVSNFLGPHLDELRDAGLPTPAVNQLELSPFILGTRRAIVDRCRADGIVLEAYSPLTKGARLDDAAVRAIADEAGRTPAQVLLRWGIQQGFVVLPRSTDPGRIAENADLWGFALDDTQMARLDALDEGLVTGWDPSSTLAG